MDIVAALFVEQFDLRQVPGPSTRLDLGGVYFSTVAPAEVPVTLEPHLVVLVRCAPDQGPDGVLEVVFRRGEEELARNVQPFRVEPGKFTYRLVRAELAFEEYGTVEAHARIGSGPATVVPLTLLAPVES